jgi:hypothetical protein
LVTNFVGLVSVAFQSREARAWRQVAEAWSRGRGRVQVLLSFEMRAA